MDDGSLKVKELLQNTYSKLSERNNPQEIVFPERALSEIADDSDWHGIRKGYMGYDCAGLFQFKGKTWAIARGEKCGDYPGSRYNSDIIALELLVDGETKEKIIDILNNKIMAGFYFKNTLIYGMSDGNLELPDTFSERFGKKALELLTSKLKKFVVQEPELTLPYPTMPKTMRYKPEFADFLADSIEQVLKKQ